MESDFKTSQVFYVSLYLYRQGGIKSTMVVSHLSPEVTPFDWNSLVEPFLPPYIPFHIVVEVLKKHVSEYYR